VNWSKGGRVNYKTELLFGEDCKYSLIKEYDDTHCIKNVSLVSDSGHIDRGKVYDDGSYILLGIPFRGQEKVDYMISVLLSELEPKESKKIDSEVFRDWSHTHTLPDPKLSYDEGFRAGVQKCMEVLSHVPFDPNDKRLVVKEETKC
jgi:hypothetical protein